MEFRALGRTAWREAPMAKKAMIPSEEGAERGFFALLMWTFTSAPTACVSGESGGGDRLKMKDLW